jgi:methyl-accepting chemotaxis protein
MRAAEAARNTNNLIENTIKAVRNGNQLTLATQEAFKKNVEISEKIGKLVEEIAAASQEQSQGISQVSKAVAEMDSVTQKNAANAEESAAAAEEMNSQAARMKVFVGELAALIGGQRNGSGAAVTAGSLPPAKRKEATPRSGEPEAGPGRGMKAPAAPQRPKELRPDQVIPLDDNDLKNFKEF